MSHEVSNGREPVVVEPRSGMSRRSVLYGGAVIGAGIVVSSVPGIAGADAAFAGQARGPQVELVRDGKTKYRIYVGADEGAIVRQAAHELASYLKSITGATFPVVSATEPPSHTDLLVVGRDNPVAAEADIDKPRSSRLVDPAVDFVSLGGDGFALRTIRPGATPGGTALLIAGGTPRGTLYGVYWVLDQLFGVRWFAADFTHTPRTKDLGVRAESFNVDQVPRFCYREMYMGDAVDPAYRQHNFLNGERGLFEGLSRPAGIDSWSTYWPAWGGSFHTLVTDQTLWSSEQLKCMEPKTRTDATASLITAINARVEDGLDPSANFIQEDAGWTDPDPASQAFADAHGGALSAPVVDMTNDVLARVRQEIPEARLGTQAYRFSQKPPTGIRESDGIVVTFAPVFANFAQSIFADVNSQFGADLEGWTKVTDDVLMWSYLTNFLNYVQPFPDWWAMGEEIRGLAELPSVKAYFGEGAYTGPGTEFGNLRTWLAARMLWDPTLDPDDLIQEFCVGYYGPAAKYIYRYMKAMVEVVAQTESSLTYLMTVEAGYLTFDAMNKADLLLGQAEAAVRNDPVLLPHVQKVRLGVDYVILMRTLEYEMTAQERVTNVALASNGAVATASSAKGAGTPDHAIDGDITKTYKWTSDPNDDEWFQIQFPQAQDLGLVVLHWAKGYATAYRLETSPDGTTWTTAAEITDSKGGTQKLWIDATNVSYLRMQGVARSSTNGYNLYEVQVHPIGPDGRAWDADRTNRLDRFETELQASGLTAYSEAGGTPENLLQMVQFASIDTAWPLPADAEQVVFQEDALMVFAPGEVVDDSLASNNSAVRMPGNNTTWSVQLNLGNLPTHGSWKLFVRMRVDTGSAPAATAAAGVGSYPPNSFLGFPASSFSDGQYHYIAIPSGFQNDPDRIVYVSPSGSGNIPYVYVDQIVAVNVG